MTEADIEVILERVKELHPEAKPRIISDNGTQFIANDFKEFIRISGMTPIRTSPYYPQSNGKIERWHKSLKGECIRPGTPLSLEDARRLVQGTSSITTTGGHPDPLELTFQIAVDRHPGYTVQRRTTIEMKAPDYTAPCSTPPEAEKR